MNSKQFYGRVISVFISSNPTDNSPLTIPPPSPTMRASETLGVIALNRCLRTNSRRGGGYCHCHRGDRRQPSRYRGRWQGALRGSVPSKFVERHQCVEGGQQEVVHSIPSCITCPGVGDDVGCAFHAGGSVAQQYWTLSHRSRDGRVLERMGGNGAVQVSALQMQCQ